jgi:hypothetical protein
MSSREQPLAGRPTIIRLPRRSCRGNEGQPLKVSEIDAVRAPAIARPPRDRAPSDAWIWTEPPTSGSLMTCSIELIQESSPARERRCSPRALLPSLMLGSRARPGVRQRSRTRSLAASPSAVGQSWTTLDDLRIMSVPKSAYRPAHRLSDDLSDNRLGLSWTPPDCLGRLRGGRLRIGAGQRGVVHP